MVLAIVLLSCAVGLLTLLVFGLLRTHAEIIRALGRAGITLDHEPASHRARPGSGEETHPPSGEQAHDIVGLSPSGSPTKVSVTGVRGLTLLAFLSSGCSTCETFWKSFAEPDLELPDPSTRLVIVGQDPPLESEAAFAELVPPGVRAVLSGTAWQDYDVPGSPFFALVDGADDRVVGAGTAAGWGQMLDTLQIALSDYGHGSDLGRDHLAGRDRESRADEALLAAGIGPDHSSVGRGRGDGGGSLPQRRDA